MKFIYPTLATMAVGTATPAKNTRPTLQDLDQMAPATPSCSPPSSSNNVITWKTCPSDNNSWYGVTKSGLTVEQAVATCLSYGGELIEIPDQDTDVCAYYTMSRDPNVKENEMVLFSGRYFDLFNVWAWCPKYKGPGGTVETECTQQMSGMYENWTNNGFQGDCMGGIINNNGATFYDYGWNKRSCSTINSARLNAMCQLKCP